MVRPMRRDTTSAMYITPANSSSITSARPRADRQHVAEADPGQGGEAQEQQLHPAPGRLGIDRGHEAARSQDLAGRVREGEAPGQQREGGAGGHQLVGGDLVVAQHVGDEAAGRVEVERALQELRPHQPLRRSAPGPEHGEHDRRRGQQPGDPVRGRAPHDDPEHQGQDQHAERVEHDPAGAGLLHERIEQHAQELHRQQRPGRMPAQGGEDARRGHTRPRRA